MKKYYLALILVLAAALIAPLCFGTQKTEYDLEALDLSATVSNYSDTQQEVTWTLINGPEWDQQMQRSVNGSEFYNVRIEGRTWFPGTYDRVFVNCTPGNAYQYRIRNNWHCRWSYTSILIFRPEEVNTLGNSH